MNSFRKKDGILERIDNETLLKCFFCLFFVRNLRVWFFYVNTPYRRRRAKVFCPFCFGWTWRSARLDSWNDMDNLLFSGSTAFCISIVLTSGVTISSKMSLISRLPLSYGLSTTLSFQGHLKGAEQNQDWSPCTKNTLHGSIFQMLSIQNRWKRRLKAVFVVVFVHNCK